MNTTVMTERVTRAIKADATDRTTANGVGLMGILSRLPRRSGAGSDQQGKSCSNPLRTGVSVSGGAFLMYSKMISRSVLVSAFAR